MSAFDPKRMSGAGLLLQTDPETYFAGRKSLL
jgi:hypothetical protein